MTRGAAQDPISTETWNSLRQQILSHAKQVDAATVFGGPSKRGSVYRWGVAVATGNACDAQLDVLSRLACGERVVKQKKETLDFAAAAHDQPADSAADVPAITAAESVVWAAALPALTKELDQTAWSQLATGLVQLHQSILQQDESSSPTHLMLGGELGLTLAWRLRDMPAFKRLQASSIEAINAWAQRDEESVSAAIANAAEARLVLASLVRCRRLIETTTKRKFGKQLRHVGSELATWVAALTTHTGGTAFSSVDRKSVADDLAPDGLLAQAAEFDPETLTPAIAAALGATQTGGRLAWQVCLPESIHHDADAKIAVLLPEWDVRRGRTHVDYSRTDVRIEVFAGRSKVLSGDIQTQIQVNGKEQSMDGDWVEVCEYSDDDVHYLEIEQPWTGGLLLQRQWMLLRDDRCLLFADTVLPSDESTDASSSINYSVRLPVAPSIEIEPEAETREMFFGDGRRRGLVMPISASEWLVGPTTATLKATEDQHLLFATHGHGRLYAPLWFDFQQRRFKRPRTWRQLTVADQLRIVQRDEAVAYRVQVGSEQWMVYRSLAEHRCRSVLGKHLIADFYSSRFDPSDGSHDALVTVDDSESEDE